MRQPTSLADKSYSSQPELIRSHISPWLIRLVYPLGCYLIMPAFFGRMEVMGRENIPLKDPVIIAPTHRSRWDALIVPYAVGRLVSGRDLRFMVTSSEMQGLQGCLVRRLGGFPVNLNRLEFGSLSHSVELLAAREMVVIFPEGGIFRDGRVHPLKRGVARIALEVEAQHPNCGIKILPISIHYSHPYQSWGSDLRVKIGSPIEVADYRSESMKQSSEQLTTDLRNALKALHQTKVKPVSIAPV
jgi:1-acyl-sn-glycerol-3-phosphate acyltransferase